MLIHSRDRVHGDEIAWPLDQHPENVQSAGARRHWDEITSLVAPGQTAAAPIETEAVEQKDVPSGEHFHGCVSHDTHIIEKVLNQISGPLAGVAGVYNRFGYAPEKRDALETWAAHVQRLIDPPSANGLYQR
jgi:hypothetical protein